MPIYSPTSVILIMICYIHDQRPCALIEIFWMLGEALVHADADKVVISFFLDVMMTSIFAQGLVRKHLQVFVFLVGADDFSYFWAFKMLAYYLQNTR